MKMTSMDETEALAEFAKQAATRFKADPNSATYAHQIAPGNFFALRWGLGDDCVLVLKLDPDFEPINFQRLIKEI